MISGFYVVGRCERHNHTRDTPQQSFVRVDIDEGDAYDMCGVVIGPKNYFSLGTSFHSPDAIVQYSMHIFVKAVRL